MQPNPSFLRKYTSFLFLGISSVFLFTIWPSFVYSAATHMLISEVQVGGTTPTDEFVEIYNPTDSPIDVTGYRLTKQSSTGVDSENNLVASLSGVVAPRSYMLIAHPDYDGSVVSDLPYSAPSNSLALDNTVVLYSDAGVTVVDTVGFGLASNVETQAATNPSVNGSIRRTSDGDSDNNFNDFAVLGTSDPTNSSFVPATASPTATATPSATPEETSTPVATATPTPTATPTGTPTPSSTPTAEPTETPTFTPTATPTATATPTPVPSPVGRVIGIFDFPNRKLVCRLNYKVVGSGRFGFVMPFISCGD